ncbi:dethiobiotin synthase [Sporohalobacter salinus]|uniref:dethiobiotin synthase n=1 Tax=Sporohalobacter salinus TaxID=1494606 RepID=UPI00195F80A3|nr:dethiobiotin synthase [Sporohalobacter salinus]MBM7622563.1 dethiobiotin synthetase [Sporohalobacter salinus]
MGQGIFITGTDTDIGKTVVTAGLTAALSQQGYDLGVMKPFQSGAFKEDDRLLAPDIEFILQHISLDADYDLMNPIRLQPPLAPSVAAKEEGVKIDLNQIMSAYQQLQEEYQGLVVEGAGGLMVPLAEDFLIPDLVMRLDLPVIIVARPNLGTINHTVLTVKAARQLGLDVLGVIINGYPKEAGVAEETNPDIISDLAEVPILGIMPYIEEMEQVDLGKIVADSVDLEIIIDSVELKY